MVAEPGPEEDYFSRRFGDLLHVDDPRQLDVMAAVGARRGLHDVHAVHQAGEHVHAFGRQGKAALAARQHGAR